MWNIFDNMSSQNNLTSGFLNQPITSNLENLAIIGMTAKLISLSTMNLDYTRKTYFINKSALEVATLNEEANVSRLNLEKKEQEANKSILIELTKAINLSNEKNNIIIEQNKEIISLLKNKGD